jgi:alpha-methylacyl-CoA racemase
MDARLRVLALVTNIPGPLAAAALARDGAAVVKIEPPAGDPLESASRAWYAAISENLRVERLDLRDSSARERVEARLAESDVLITAMRAGSLQRLGLDWTQLHARYPRLCHVAIAGEAAPHDDRPGHDLTYQAQAGLVRPPAMPLSVFADLFAAERAAAAAYRALFLRERTGRGSRIEVAIAAGAARLADAQRYGLTRADGPLGGALAVYRLYETSDGWIALAALEPHFQSRLREALRIETLDVNELSERFVQHSCAYWEDLARRYDLPLAAVAKA